MCAVLYVCSVEQTVNVTLAQLLSFASPSNPKVNSGNGNGGAAVTTTSPPAAVVRALNRTALHAHVLLIPEQQAAAFAAGRS